MTEWRTSAVATATGRTLAGYALRWADTAAIVEGGKRFDEQVRRGAFARSLANGPPTIIFAHGRSALGLLPVGRLVRIEEDSVGLAIEVEVYDTETNLPVLDAVRSGGLRSLSIGFQVVDERWDRSRRPPLRTLLEVDLPEISVVSRPAYKQSVAGLRGGRLAELMAEREAVVARIERLEVAGHIRDERRRKWGVQRRRELAAFEARQAKAAEIRKRNR